MATLADGREVAVKVQRPDVYTQVGLDMYIIRASLAWLRDYWKTDTDIPAVADEVARDYSASWTIASRLPTRTSSPPSTRSCRSSGRVAGLVVLTTFYFAVKKPLNDRWYGPSNQSSDIRE